MKTEKAIINKELAYIRETASRIHFTWSGLLGSPR